MGKRKRNKKLNTAYYRAMGISMLIFMGLIAVVGLAAPDKEYSDTEKRSLETFPDISIAGITSGSFMKGFEEYISDQIVSRDIWMELNTSFQSLLGRREVNGVYSCSKDYLMERFDEPDLALIQRTAESVNGFAARYDDCRSRFIIAPTACEIYAELLPGFAINASEESYINDFYEKLTIDSLALVDVLMANKDRTELYYHTDHHWTTDAAYIAYREYAKELGLDGMSYSLRTVDTDFNGSLSAKSGYERDYLDSIKVGIPEKEQKIIVTYEDEKKKTASCYDYDKLLRDDAYQVFFGGNHAQITIDTDNHNGRRVIVFKDSYANCFIPFMVGDFEKITIIDPRYYYDDIDELMLQNKYTDALFLYNANTLSTDNNLYEILGEKR